MGLWRIKFFGKDIWKRAVPLMQAAPALKYNYRNKPVKNAHIPMLDQSSWRWRCLSCFRSDTTIRGLNFRECGDLRPDAGLHSMWQLGPFVFCIKCGSYGDSH